MLRLFEKMYDDMKPKAQNLKDRAPDAFEKIANNSSLGPEERASILQQIQNII